MLPESRFDARVQNIQMTLPRSHREKRGDQTWRELFPRLLVQLEDSNPPRTLGLIRRSVTMEAFDYMVAATVFFGARWCRSPANAGPPCVFQGSLYRVPEIRELVKLDVVSDQAKKS